MNDPDAAPIWLGNGSTYWTDGAVPKTSKEMTQPQQQTTAFVPAGDDKEVDDDLPF